MEVLVATSLLNDKVITNREAVAEKMHYFSSILFVVLLINVPLNLYILSNNTLRTKQYFRAPFCCFSLSQIGELCHGRVSRDALQYVK